MLVSHSEFLKQSCPLAAIAFAVICVSLLTLPNRARVSSDTGDSEIVGNWSGDSICQVANSACQNEKVVYHIAMAKDAGKLTVQADKIVAGSPVSMGSIDFDYDKRNGTLINRSSRGVWKFMMHGKSMDGTLTLPDTTVYRKVTLRKDENKS
jgi:hypothetical protein